MMLSLFLLHIAAQTENYCPLVSAPVSTVVLAFACSESNDCIPVQHRIIVFDYPLAVGRCANVRASIYTKGDLLFWLSSRPG